MALPHPNGAERPSGSLVVVRTLDMGASETFVRITADGSVTAYNGHVDLGTGVRTALAQIVAEELDVSFARVAVVLGDTALVPNQGATIASETIQITAVPLRKAAAQARHFLLARAAEKLELGESELTIEDGEFVGRSLIAVDENSVRDIPGLVAVVTQGDFIGVVAEREENAIKAAAQLKVRWKPVPPLPDLKDLETALRANPSTPRVLVDK